MAFERRLEDSLPIKPADLQNKDWPEVSDELMRQVEGFFNRNREKMFGPNGQLARDMKTAIDRMNQPEVSENLAIQLMEVMSRGTRMVFDRKTHKQTWMATTRLRYIYLAARLLQGQTAANITLDVLEHLTGALDALKELWGGSEWSRLMQLSLMPGDVFFKRLAAVLGDEETSRLNQVQLNDWPEDIQDTARVVLGEQVMNEINRHLLLSVISELWVEYLTRVEALRVSIGLEAYAQRDPLVMYKSRASELFTNLLRDIRAGIITRAFTYRPRQAVKTVENAASTAPVPNDEQEDAKPASVSKNKKRRRH
jgi:preprotein translocase subunit SecA